ncbi:MAG TPA: MarR family transcriptional regulator [Acidimicrobiales bacterium]|nr:MarR family transcriptional regulator [Acidimicrobiales bacterium]
MTRPEAEPEAEAEAEEPGREAERRAGVTARAGSAPRHAAETAPHWRTPQLMRALLRQATLHARSVLAGQGHSDLRPIHLLVLERLAQSEMRASELATALGLTKQATGQILDRMEAVGYLRRTPDPDDGRAKLVELTERGRRAAEILRSAAEETDRRWRDALGEAAHSELRAALGRLLVTEGP